jgi:hypothetical protein
MYFCTFTSQTLFLYRFEQARDQLELPERSVVLCPAVHIRINDVSRTALEEILQYMYSCERAGIMNKSFEGECTHSQTQTRLTHSPSFLHSTCAPTKERKKDRKFRLLCPPVVLMSVRRVDYAANSGLQVQALGHRARH